jgi:hypothetical protein
MAVAGIAAVALLGGAFALSAWKAWEGRLTLRMAVWIGVALHVVFVALPLLISHDAYHYSLYGRIASVHHQNPYVVTPSHFPSDPIFPFFSEEWRDTPALYGPAFIQLASGVTRLIRSPAGLVFFFKLLSGAASLATMLLVARLVRRTEPARAAFAVVLIGWNPVVLVHTVGAGHMDSLIALAVAAAFGLLLGAGGQWTGRGTRPRDLGVTALLSGAALLKPPMLLPLVLFAGVRMWQQERGLRARALAMHLATFLLLAVPLVAPFEQRQDPLLGVSYLAKYTSALAPSTFLRVIVRRILGTRSGIPISNALAVALTLVFLAAFVMLLKQLASRSRQAPPLDQGAAWAWVLLVFLLTAPILWPWYLVWILPLAWVLPSTPRLGVIAMSATLPVFVSVAEGSVHGQAYAGSIAMSMTLAGPVLLVFLAFVLSDLARRIRSAAPLADGRMVPTA